jgi:predicted PurR-regulated permease PerM
MAEFRQHWSPQAKLTISLLILALTIFLIYRFRVILAPMILAVILAYILSPVESALQNRLKIRRTLATFLTYLLLLGLLGTLPVLLFPVLASQFTALNLDFVRILQEVERVLGHQYVIAGQTVNVDALIQQAVGSLQGLLEPVFGQTLSLAVDVISSVVWVIFILVVSFYLIKDGPKLRDWFEGIMPPGFQHDFIRLRDEVSHIWSAFFRGQLVLALVVAIIFTIVGFILGLPFALAMGVFAGLLEFLPSIGHGIWLAIAALLALFVGSTWLPLPNWAFMLLVIGLHVFYQQFDLNYLIPRIIGRSVHLPPLVVILGIVAGAVMAGVLGVVLAAPTIASARVLGRYLYANLFDMEPFAEHAAPPLPPPNPRWWRTGVTSPPGIQPWGKPADPAGKPPAVDAVETRQESKDL